MTFNLFRENDIFHEGKDDGGNIQNPKFKVTTTKLISFIVIRRLIELILLFSKPHKIKKSIYTDE